MNNAVKGILILLMLILVSNAFALTPTVEKGKFPSPSFLQEFGVLTVRFDLVRVVQPYSVNNTNPPTYRAYLPSCPLDTRYVSGVFPNILQMDQSPNFDYCQCVCLNQCGGLSGVSSTGGNRPIYTAKVTCEATIQGWFDKTILQQSGGMLRGVKYSYCQSGDCSTQPLPAFLNYTIPVGGYANTVKIDFLSCPVAVANKVCSAPDPNSMGKQSQF